MNAGADCLSDMEISDGDGEVDYDAVLDMIIRQEDEEFGDPPPVFPSNDLEELDTSDALLVLVDGPKLKKKSKSHYMGLLEFWSDCRLKCNLTLFSHPGDPVEGGLSSWEGKQLEGDDFSLEHANRAITKYNRLRKDGRLKLEKLIKVNFAAWGAMVFYMTFSARNEDTGELGIYQAALRELRAGYVLGLFRDCTADKILAILSVTGGEEDLAGKRKIVECAKAGVTLSLNEVFKWL